MFGSESLGVGWILLLCGGSVVLGVIVLIAVRMLGSRLARMEAALPQLEQAVRPIAETALHAREAKDEVLRIGSEFAEFQGRLGAVAEGQIRLSESIGTSQSAAQSQMAEAQQRLLEMLTAWQGGLQRFLAATDERQRREVEARLTAGFQANADAVAQMRIETAGALRAGEEAMSKSMSALRESNETKLAAIIARTTESSEALNRTAQQTLATVSERVAELKASVDAALKSELGAIRKENGEKLEAMRVTVDEKLHATLEQRLGDSFKLVSERLEQVHRGLGEMQTLATGVGDLRKVLTNVKTRGTWGEVQLANLLDQVLTPEQYEKNIAPRPGSAARVEFALKLPGRSDDGPVYLPIDAKFPLEDYQRLVDAQERADIVGVEEAGKALDVQIRLEGKAIRDKYIEPPHTTDFAVLYLSTEGLYAEVLRRPGLADWLQRECKVVLSGPTTLAAMLNSLQMGFRTLAIEKRSSEVWQVLGAVKAEFGKFGEALAHTKKKLEEATSSIEKTQTRNNVLTRKLKGVDQLPAPEAINLLAVVAEPGTEDLDDAGNVVAGA
jgi:DNA recombination protein RmuC